METELGTRLMERSARKVALTRAGREFLTSAREALRNVDIAVRAAQIGAGEGIGSLSIGLMIGAAHPVVGRMVAAFRAANPSATVTLTSIDERALGTSLIEDKLDCAVSYDDCVPQGLHSLPLFEKPLDVVLAPDHPLAQHETIAPDALGRVPLILPDRAGHPIIYERFRAPPQPRERAGLRGQCRRHGTSLRRGRRRRRGGGGPARRRVHLSGRGSPPTGPALRGRLQPGLVAHDRYRSSPRQRCRKAGADRNVAHVFASTRFKEFLGGLAQILV